MKNPQKQYTTTLQNDIGKKDKQKKEKKKENTNENSKSMFSKGGGK